jgi:hypothetical protein
MPEDVPDKMSEDMPDRVPDRMPEDMPILKCINSMVGITRSKVIFIFQNCAKWVPFYFCAGIRFYGWISLFLGPQTTLQLAEGR